MNIYCAGKFQQGKYIKEIARIFEDKGHKITAQWWKMENQLKPYDIAFYDFNGVEEADVVVVLMVDNLEYYGTLMEIGYALHAGKPVYIISSDEKYSPYAKSPLMLHPNIIPFSGFPDSRTAKMVEHYVAMATA